MLTAIVTTGLVCLVTEKLFKIELSFFFFFLPFHSIHGEPGMLQFIGSQRVRQDLATEKQQELLLSSRISSYSGGI